MDPNTNLDEQLYLAAEIRKIITGAADGFLNADERANLMSKGLRLAELIESLDHWITGGGFVPDRWNARPVPGGLYVGKDR